ncbi:hypothetical protein ACFL6N_06070 [Thermodesulfobacteriota bacterium]
MAIIHTLKNWDKLLILATLTTVIVLFGLKNARAVENVSLPSHQQGLWADIVQDHRNYYSWRNLWSLGIAFGVGGAMAYSDIDEDVREWYQDDVRSSSTDDFAEIVKNFGEGEIMIPLTLLAAGAGYFIPEESRASPIGEWGLKTTRSYLVGVPSMLLMQRVTGASRPDESSSGSEWNFSKDNNGVSGHAFMGAVPFMTVAGMNDNLMVKILSYGASMLCAWSRINDDDHYVSQAALGWFMALQASDSVFQTDRDREKSYSFLIVPMGADGVGIMLAFSR